MYYVIQRGAKFVAVSEAERVGTTIAACHDREDAERLAAQCTQEQEEALQEYVGHTYWEM